MSSFYTYKNIRYELKETQGFYYCLVFAEGEDTALFQTKYYASVDGATNAAINFIDDYSTYRKTKEEKIRFRRSKPPVEKHEEIIEEETASEEKTEEHVHPRQLFEGTNLLQSAVPDKDPNRTWKSKSLESKSSEQKSKIWQENGEIRSTVTKVVSGLSMRSTPMSGRAKQPYPKFVEEEQEKQKIRAMPVILLVGVALISISVIVASASGFLESLLHRDSATPPTPPTATQFVEVSPTPPEATIGLPAVNPTPIGDPTRTPTITMTASMTITPTITASRTPTQVTRTPTKTSKPTNPPAATKTYTLSPSATNTLPPTNTSTQAPSLTPSSTPTSTATTAPWDTFTLR